MKIANDTDYSLKSGCGFIFDQELFISRYNNTEPI